MPLILINALLRVVKPGPIEGQPLCAKRIEKCMDAGIEEVCFFMYMHNEGKSLELTQYASATVQQTVQGGIPEIRSVEQSKDWIHFFQCDICFPTLESFRKKSMISL